MLTQGKKPAKNFFNKKMPLKKRQNSRLHFLNLHFEATLVFEIKKDKFVYLALLEIRLSILVLKQGSYRDDF